MLTIERIVVTARLDDPAPALDRAKREAAAGDESWEQWVSEYRRGEALIVALDVAVEAENGGHRRVEVTNRGVFVEADVHPPKVERQIYEIVCDDFSMLAGELAELDRRLEHRDLCEMYVHVELAADLVAALKAGSIG
jgi:hypothetical protein